MISYLCTLTSYRIYLHVTTEIIHDIYRDMHPYPALQPKICSWLLRRCLTVAPCRPLSNGALYGRCGFPFLSPLLLGQPGWAAPARCCSPSATGAFDCISSACVYCQNTFTIPMQN